MLIPAEELPKFPGAAALEFVVGLARLDGCSKDQQPDQLKKDSEQQEHQNEACIVAKTNGDDLVGEESPLSAGIQGCMLVV